jgi:glycosyltransferase involved in cell wall biosynthesis
MTPLVSFLTPAYNAAAYLADTVRSALAQTWPRVEMIIVNDGSRDDTLAVARSIRDPRVKVVDQENSGQSASENRAFRESQGEYVFHLDADDLITPNKAEVQVRRLLEAEPGCVSFGRWGRFYEDPAKTRFVPERFWRDIAPVDLHVEMWERLSMIQGGCYLLPRSLVERAGPWDESLSLINDFDFFPRVLLQAPRMLFCPEAVLYYRSNLPTSLSGSKSTAAWDSAFRALQSGTGRLLAVEDSPRTRRACSREFEELVYSSYPAVPELRRRAWGRVRELGGPYFRPQMGPRMAMVSRVVGWKLARRLQAVARWLGSRAPIVARHEARA